MRILRSLFSSVARTGDEPPQLWLERQIIYVRWFGIVCAIPSVLLIPTLQPYRLHLLIVTLFTSAYNIVLPALAKRHPERISLIGAACDAIASGFFVWIAGFDSPAYLVLLSIIIASSMRFGMGVGLGVVLFFTALDLASHLIEGQPDLALIGFRSSCLAVDAVLSAVLYSYAKQGDVLLRRTNEQLQAAIERLTQLDAMKSNFISNASHELRTPLTAIRSFSEFLTDDAQLQGEAQEFARIINDESERLSRLVSDLLDLTRIESGAAQHREAAFDVGSQLRHVFIEQEPLAIRKDLDFRLDLPDDLPLVWGDADAIHQVLLNLTSNAIKFTPKGSVVMRAGKDLDSVSVAVADSGIGISADDQQHIFERFYQAGNTLTEKPSGTGLGLAIAKEVLKRHGSELHVQSTPGEGSIFSFSLPCFEEGRSGLAEPSHAFHQSVPAAVNGLVHVTAAVE